MAKIICMDAGHGGYDPGAPAGGYRESDIALQITLKIGAILARAGVKVVYTRTSDVFVDLMERCRISDRAGADAFCSIHLNSNDNVQAHGVETFAYSNACTNAVRLATLVQNNLVSVTGFSNRGVKTGDFCVIRETACDAILVETGFISNASNRANLINGSFQDKVADAIARGLLSFVGVSYKPATSTPNKPNNSASSSSSKDLYNVIVGSYANKANADACKKQINNKGVGSWIIQRVVNGKKVFRVTFGGDVTKAVANDMLKKAKSMGYSSAFIAYYK